MNPHKIDLEELKSWISETTVTFASSTRERKRLEATLSGGLIVSIAGKVVWEGILPYFAVMKYNSITEPYQNPNKEFVL